MRGTIRTLGILLTCVSLCACDLVAQQLGAPRWGKQTYESVSTPTFTGVIVPASRARELVEPMGVAQVQGYRTPPRDVILLLEQRVADYVLAAAQQRSPLLWRKLRMYQRQYAGIVRDGHQIVFCSFFCNAPGVDWVSEPVIVLDGGDCFFQFEYDVESRVFSNLRINGEA